MHAMFSQLKPSEVDDLGLESTEDHLPPAPEGERSSTYNFDHVSASYGDVESGVAYISAALLFPISFLTSQSAPPSPSSAPASPRQEQESEQGQGQGPAEAARRIVAVTSGTQPREAPSWVDSSRK